ncbi:MAG: ABC transporter permease [Planctomycetota bacterium]
MTPAHSAIKPTQWIAFRELLWNLTWRDIRVRYRQTMLGIAWAVLSPLSMMVIFTFVFGGTQVSTEGIPYALYAYCGLAPWAFFANSLNGAANSIVAHRSLVTKVYFPREVFPLSCVAGALVDFCISLMLLFGLMAYFARFGGHAPRIGSALLMLPVVIVVQILLTVGLGLLVSMANLFYRDVRSILALALQLGLFVSAVVVPLPSRGSTAYALLSWNPMVSLMQSYRDCLLHGRWPEFGGLTYAAAVGVVVVGVSAWLFRRASPRFAECV